jgi:hypothetical protein
MKKETINILADAIKEYYGDYELEDLCNQFNIEVDYLGVSPNHKRFLNQTIAINAFWKKFCRIFSVVAIIAF